MAQEGEGGLSFRDRLSHAMQEAGGPREFVEAAMQLAHERHQLFAQPGAVQLVTDTARRLAAKAAAPPEHSQDVEVGRPPSTRHMAGG